MTTEYKNTDSYKPVFFEYFIGVYASDKVKSGVNKTDFWILPYVKNE